jgi:uncharacterized protein (DUF1330 family)
MPAYAIGRLRAENWSWLKEYGPPVTALIEKHGGRYLARGGAMKNLEGDEGLPDAYVMLEFPSMEQAQAWYDDPEYAPLIELRQANCGLQFHLIQGLEP